jgi:thiamine biosynthesis protein ThiI
MRLLSLMSGGIDSPVAAYLMLKRGFDVDYLHFYHSEDLEKIIQIVKKLNEHTKKQGRLFVCPHLEIVNLTLEFEERYTCVYCKISMLKTAEKLAEEIRAKALLTGDSLGQVASQTVSNLFVEDRSVKIPVIRPLIGFDKVEIVDISKKAGTYELSILPSVGCQAVPDKPATAAKIDKITYEIIDISDVFHNIREIEV